MDIMKVFEFGLVVFCLTESSSVSVRGRSLIDPDQLPAWQRAVYSSFLILLAGASPSPP